VADVNKCTCDNDVLGMPSNTFGRNQVDIDELGVHTFVG
jgi:hypothetical protein